MKKDNNGFKLVGEEDKVSFIKELKKIDWNYWLNRPYSVFMGTLFWEGVREEVFARNDFKGLEPNNHLYQFPDLFYDKKFREKGVVFFDRYFKSNKMSNISDALAKVHSHHIAELNKLIADKKKTIPKKTKILSELVQDYIPYIWIIINLEDYFDKRIASEVPKYVKGDYSKFVGDISLPKKKNVYVMMLDEISSGVSNKKIVEKYGWMRSRDGFTDFYNKEEIEEIRKGIKENNSTEVDIPEGLVGLSEELKELNFFRTSRTDKFYEFFGVARPLMKEISEYVGVSFKELANYDTNSIIWGKPQRYNKDFSYGLIGSRYCISNKPLIPEYKNSVGDEVKGNVAYKGLVRGIAKIVTHQNDAEKVKKGDILVAQMTFPSFIAIMQKAAAFVTDEGSITCHAAIIAREMRKPCIVGTKNGTQILKDGDLVEVDANNGIVKIIK
jgi:phosphohistidine swiveling domain-containing protein/uncharacterized protein (UPF0216 family)